MTIAQKEHLQRLKTLNDMIAGGLSREQFVALFTQVLDFVKKIDKGNSEMREKMEAMHERLMSQLTSDNAIQINSAMQEAKTMIINMFGASMEKMSREHTKMMSEMKNNRPMEYWLSDIRLGLVMSSPTMIIAKLSPDANLGMNRGFTLKGIFFQNIKMGIERSWEKFRITDTQNIK